MGHSIPRPFVVTLLMVAAAAGLLVAPQRVDASGRLGSNLGEVSYYQGAVPFNDLVRQSGNWIAQGDGRGWGEGKPLKLRRDGWPARLLPGQFGTLPLAEGSYPAGEYRVSWRGAGRFTITGREFSGRNGSGSVQLDGSSIVLMDLRATKASDPLRSIRVVVPGADSALGFRQAYLDSLSPYSVLRFMDWQRTNATYEQTNRRFSCSNRTRPSYYSEGTRKGVSTETMVALANRLDADPWFTIPHDATDGWLRCQARVVRKKLDPGLVPRYEFSNETWNPTFLQFRELTDAGSRQGLGGGDEFLGLQQEVARRHAQAMAIVRAVFGKRRFIRVMAGQAANSWVAEQRLQFASTAASVDEIAIAPYVGVSGANPFDPIEAQSIASMSLTGLFASMDTALEDEVSTWITDHVDLAGRLGKDLVAYEGGQHLAGDPQNDGLTSLFISANRDPRMGDLYERYLERWKALTGDSLFVHFTDSSSYGRYGSWGAVESPDSLPLTDSPKYAALGAFAAAP